MKTINGSKELTAEEVDKIVTDQLTPSEESSDSPELVKMKKRYRHLGVVYQLLSQGLFLGNHCEAIKDGLECLDELYKETHETIGKLTSESLDNGDIDKKENKTIDTGINID